MKKYIPTFLLILSVPLTYFVIAVATLSNYGINWDEPFHFNRGYAYLHYFLSGEKNYLNLPQYPKLKGSSDFMGREGEDELYLNSKSSTIAPDPSYRRSYFQSDVFNFEYFARFDGFGHPPINDILAAFFNHIFYQRLGILGDIEAFHLFEVTAAFLLILGLSIFVYLNFGLLASLVASFSLSFYPLFFAESHFNVKDPVETALFGLTIITFYFGIVKKRWKIMILSAILAGLALGTKFNALFLPFIIIPWLILHIMSAPKQLIKDKKLLIILIFYPAIVLLILYAFWPYLWNEPIKHLWSVLQFYKEAGTTPTGELNSFIFKGFNLFPVFWILITTPLPILVLGFIGFIFAFKRLWKKELVYLLILLWLLVPILRVSLPGTTIHSGVRHIMEFIPAMAVLAGLGAKLLFQIAKNHIYKTGVLAIFLLVFGFIIWEVARLHPNENVYFNQLVSGLAGAKEKNIPYWGNSYGNVYLQGVNWLNQNAEPQAELALPIVNMVNVPRIKLRSDIDFSNAHLSGPRMQGEYVMEMSHNWGPNNWFAYDYYDSYLFPLYEVKVLGVPLLKIWKNDLKYLKVNFEEEKKFNILSFRVEKNILNIDIGRKILLTRLEIQHNERNCQKQKGGYIRLSTDGKNWVQQSETIDYPQIPVSWLGQDKNTFVFLFAAKSARFIFLDTQMENSCILINPDLRVFGF